MERKTLYVWRTETRRFDPFTSDANCQWCNSELMRGHLPPKSLASQLGLKEVEPVENTGPERPHVYCLLCGWEQVAQRYFSNITDDSNTRRRRRQCTGDNEVITTSVLRAFDVDSPRVALSELGTHLKNNFTDVYSVHSERFEAIVNDVFRAHGYRTILTRATKDKGVDIVLLSRDGSSIEGIVECKRYAETRKIGVELVKQLMGTAVQWRLNRAYLVTSSSFTSGARDVAVNYAKQGYEFDLLGASDLLKLLQVYNERLPTLDKLSERLRNDIVDQNRSNASKILA